MKRVALVIILAIFYLHLVSAQTDANITLQIEGDIICGNGYAETGEECDTTNTTDTCDTQGLNSNTNGNCTLTFCGDGTVQTTNGEGAVEVCDDGNLINGDGCDVLCRTENVGGGGSSGGGGGGGSSSSSRTVEVEADDPQFVFVSEARSFRLRQGSTDQFSVIVENLEDTSLSLTLTTDLDLLRIREPTLVLSPGERKRVIVDVIASVDTPLDLYLGRITASSAQEERDVLLSIEVISPGALFDVIVDLDVESYVAGESVLAEINLIKLIDAGTEDVVVYYEIRNATNDVLVTDSDTRAVETTLGYLKRMDLPEDLPEGEYIFYVWIEYDDKVASASSWFSVRQSSSLFDLLNERPWQIGLGVALGAVVFLIYLILRIRKRVKKGYW